MKYPNWKNLSEEKAQYIFWNKGYELSIAPATLSKRMIKQKM